MIKKNQIPTILGIVILLAGVVAGVIFLNARQVFRIGADASVMPKDIRTSNVGDTSATISWTTDKETVGFIVWGESQNSINSVDEESGETSLTHSINLTGLDQSKTYFYKINSDGTEFDNGGIPWEFTTGPPISSSPESYIISGSVITPSGQSIKKGLVYITVNGYLGSTTTSDLGNFIFQLGAIRTQDLGSYIQIKPAATLLEISVQSGTQVASAQIFPQSANPIPPIILGQVHDFRNNEPNKDGQNPSADIKLPADAESESKFDVTETGGSPAPSSVILESLSDGETVTSTQPAFFGRGPSGESITIIVESENPVTDDVTIGGDGTWTWSPPTDLAPGPHKVTISWIDTAGITRILTRNFIVQAGEAPAFEATPSQTLAPTLSPTPSATPKPTITATATSSAVPVPVTGSLTASILFGILGIGVTTLSFAIWKFSENA